jgi:hypothetical protein
MKTKLKGGLNYENLQPRFFVRKIKSQNDRFIIRHRGGSRRYALLQYD